MLRRFVWQKVSAPSLFLLSLWLLIIQRETQREGGRRESAREREREREGEREGESEREREGGERRETDISGHLPLQRVWGAEEGRGRWRSSIAETRQKHMRLPNPNFHNNNPSRKRRKRKRIRRRWGWRTQETPPSQDASSVSYCQLTSTSGWSECCGEESAGWWRHKRAHSFGRGGLVEPGGEEVPCMDWLLEEEKKQERRGGGGRRESWRGRRKRRRRRSEGGRGGGGGGGEGNVEVAVLFCWLLLLLGGRGWGERSAVA